METNPLIEYLDSNHAEYEKWYTMDRKKYLQVAQSLLNSLSNCNINVLESCKLNSFLRIAKSFLDKNEIFEDWTNVRSLTDFILLNLAIKHEGEQKNFTLKLLQLLTDVLKRTKPIHARNLLDKKRLLDTILPLLDSDVSIAGNLLNIINLILRMEGVFKYNVNDSLQLITRMLIFEEDIENICHLAKLILDKMSQMNEKTVAPILHWITTKSVSYIKKENIELEKKKELLSLIVHLKLHEDSESKVSFSKNFRSLMLRLMVISDKVWVLCKKDHPINCVAQEVFNFTLLQFLIEENMLTCDEASLMKDMSVFHSDSGEEFPEKYFFFICHMQEKHSRLGWSSRIVLESMEYWFFNKRQQIDAPVFKSIVFLFPRLAISFLEPKYIAWSNDILRIISAYPSLSEILSFCQIQLVWILKMGHPLLRMEVMRHWINRMEYHRILKKAIKLCQAERTLLNLILKDSENESGRIASEFLQKLASRSLSREISRMLPAASKQPHVFNCLILARPAVPERVEEKMLMLELVSIMIPSLTDDYVLRAACIYANDLLVDMKREPNCLLCVSKYIPTIKFLLSALHKTKEDVSKEILFLFRNFISIQVKFQFELESSVETDPLLFLKGSTRQINRVLTIFPIILSSKTDPLIKFRDETKLMLFFQILEYVDETDKQENSLRCLHLLIKKYNWLSFSGVIGSFVKIWCGEQFEVDKSHLFMIFIILWLKNMIRYPKILHPMIPALEIQNFFMRNGDTNQINCCSKILKILQREDDPGSRNDLSILSKDSICF